MAYLRQSLNGTGMLETEAGLGRPCLILPGPIFQSPRRAPPFGRSGRHLPHRSRLSLSMPLTFFSVLLSSYLESAMTILISKNPKSISSISVVITLCLCRYPVLLPSSRDCIAYWLLAITISLPVLPSVAGRTAMRPKWASLTTTIIPWIVHSGLNALLGFLLATIS